jgi:Ku protein
MWRARPLSASRFGRSTRSTGNCLRQQLIDEETREPVPPEHKGRGYEVAKGQYLVVEDAELDAIEIESTHTIEIDSFVPRAQVDQRFFDTPYYVTPSEPVGQEAFAVIRESLEPPRPEFFLAGDATNFRGEAPFHRNKSRFGTLLGHCGQPSLKLLSYFAP